MMRGVTATTKDGKLVIQLATGSTLDPPRIGDALIATIRRELPKIERIRAEVIFDVPRLTRDVKGVQQERDARLAEVRAETEEGIDQFVTCIGCSPFAPDHVCVITPERPPQCGRGYAQLKAGALYGYDDMSNIHHRSLHANMNSFGVCAKGSPVDPAAGEWEGINAAMSQLTDGRVTRLTLHSLDECPHTGCSCFRLIMFKLEPPHTGIGVMDRAFEGQAPDGRGWADLHYALTGKQTPGMAGAAPGYLVSPKFLAAHGGWDSVVWVSPKIAVTMGDKLPTRVAVGDG